MNGIPPTPEQEAEIRRAVVDIDNPWWPGLTETDWCRWCEDLLAALDSERARAAKLAEALAAARAESELLKRALVEEIGGGKGEALRWSLGQPSFYARDLANHLGIVPQHADNHLLALHELGLVTRERDDPSAGGKRFRYSSALASRPGEAAASPLLVGHRPKTAGNDTCDLALERDKDTDAS